MGSIPIPGMAPGGRVRSAIRSMSCVSAKRKLFNYEWILNFQTSVVEQKGCHFFVTYFANTRKVVTFLASVTIIPKYVLSDFFFLSFFLSDL